MCRSLLILKNIHQHRFETDSVSLKEKPIDSFKKQVRSPKVPFPIFVASLPKSGTTSIARYFYCGNVWTAHTFVNTPDHRQMRVGECFQQNVLHNRSVWENCGSYNVYSDAGFVRGRRCYYPSVHGLEELYRSHPNSTIILVKRDKQKWYDSISRWKNGNLLLKWRACDGFPGRKANATDYMDFYEHHAEAIRQFAKEHPSMTFLEFQLEDQNISSQLEEKIGVQASCLGHHNSYEKKMIVNPKFRKEILRHQRNIHN